MDMLYEKYKASTDTTIEINGVRYFKILRKEKLPIIDGLVFIYIPLAFFDHKAYQDIQDESGRTFELAGPEMVRFHGNIPEWYMNCGSFPVLNIHEIDEIGDHVTLSRST